MILAGALAGVGFAATLAIALGRAAARGDQEIADLLAERLSDSIAASRESYAGFARGPADDLPRPVDRRSVVEYERRDPAVCRSVPGPPGARASG